MIPIKFLITFRELSITRTLTPRSNHLQNIRMCHPALAPGRDTHTDTHTHTPTHTHTHTHPHTHAHPTQHSHTRTHTRTKAPTHTHLYTQTGADYHLYLLSAEYCCPHKRLLF